MAGGTQPQGDGGGDIPKTTVYCPRYDKKRLRALMNKVGPMRDVLKCILVLGLTLPPSPLNASEEACPPYHIKGVCNSRYGRAGYHVKNLLVTLEKS